MLALLFIGQRHASGVMSTLGPRGLRSNALMARAPLAWRCFVDSGLLWRPSLKPTNSKQLALSVDRALSTDSLLLFLFLSSDNMVRRFCVKLCSYWLKRIETVEYLLYFKSHISVIHNSAGICWVYKSMTDIAVYL